MDIIYGTLVDNKVASQAMGKKEGLVNKWC